MPPVQIQISSLPMLRSIEENNKKGERAKKDDERGN